MTWLIVFSAACIGFAAGALVMALLWGDEK